MREAIGPDQAAALVSEGTSVMVGGFLGLRTPEPMVDTPVARSARGLTIPANDTAKPARGVRKRVGAGCVRRAIVSQISANPGTRRMMIEGEITVELVPQGALEVRIRAGPGRRRASDGRRHAARGPRRGEDRARADSAADIGASS